MNLDEYRALIAQEKELAENPVVEETEPKQITETVEPETKPNETGEPVIDSKDEGKPETIEIDGEHFTIDELRNGYLRQSDYTRKTQELSKRERQVKEAIQFMEEVQKNPQVAQELSSQFEMPNLDPANVQYRELEDRYFELLIDTELNKLTNKYGEFDATAVLETARDNGINDLEVAYHIVQSRKGGGQAQGNLDVDALRTQIREEVLNELKIQEQASVDTSTLVQPGGAQTIISNNTPKLSKAEQKVARAMGMSEKDYATWRDGKVK